jgi:hypothetical protein
VAGGNVALRAREASDDMSKSSGSTVVVSRASRIAVELHDAVARLRSQFGDDAYLIARA